MKKNIMDLRPGDIILTKESSEGLSPLIVKDKATATNLAGWVHMKTARDYGESSPSEYTYPIEKEFEVVYVHETTIVELVEMLDQINIQALGNDETSMYVAIDAFNTVARKFQLVAVRDEVHQCYTMGQLKYLLQFGYGEESEENTNG